MTDYRAEADESFLTIEEWVILTLDQAVSRGQAA
jgi:hypothetical protein